MSEFSYTVIYLEKDIKHSKHINRSDVQSEHYKTIAIKGRLENFASSIEISAFH